MIQIRHKSTGAVLLALEAESLAGAKLTGAKLQGASLQGQDLRGAYISNADLREADLRGADFTNANMNGTALDFVNAAHSKFSGADLTDCTLAGADFTDATVDKTEFKKTVGTPSVFPKGIRKPRKKPSAGSDSRWSRIAWNVAISRGVNFERAEEKKNQQRRATAREKRKGYEQDSSILTRHGHIDRCRGIAVDGPRRASQDRAEGEEGVRFSRQSGEHRREVQNHGRQR
jgi:hypothetical protein